MAAHTKEPWAVHNHPIGPYIMGAENDNPEATGQMSIAECNYPRGVYSHRRQANAQRIVDCVNGCTNVPNPAAIPEAVKALENIRLAFTAASKGDKITPAMARSVENARVTLDALNGRR